MSGIKEEVPPVQHQAAAQAAVVSVDAIKNAAIVGVLAVAVLVVGFFCCRGFWRYFSYRWTEYWSGGGRRKKVVEYEEVDDDGDDDDYDDADEDEVPAAPARRKRQPATRRR